MRWYNSVSLSKLRETNYAATAENVWVIRVFIFKHSSVIAKG